MRGSSTQPPVDPTAAPQSGSRSRGSAADTPAPLHHHHPATSAPPRAGPAPAAASGSFIGQRSGKPGPPPSPTARDRLSSAMRPGAPGPLWPLPWGALAWAVGLVGSMGSGDPKPGEWGSRKRRAGAGHPRGAAGNVAPGGAWARGWPRRAAGDAELGRPGRELGVREGKKVYSG